MESVSCPELPHVSESVSCPELPHVSDTSDTDELLQDLASLNDINLLRATMESLESGRLTPLIKEELRCRIQSRRLSEGKGELLVEFPSPTPSHPRPDEVDKKDRRREQNRRAAQKFRKKKKERGERLIEETQRLECQNSSLMSEIKQLHEERQQLTRIIQSHANICPLTPGQSPVTTTPQSPTQDSLKSLPSSTDTTPPDVHPALSTNIPTQCSANLVVPSNRNPGPVLVGGPSLEKSNPSPFVPNSPFSSRSRKSPIPAIRNNQSPTPGDKVTANSPTPPKQVRHSIPPCLNLTGPKTALPLLPKPVNMPSPLTPKSLMTSPLPIASSPCYGNRSATKVSPVFFGEACFATSYQPGPPSHSPASNISSSSTPGGMTQHSPLFFGDKSTSSAPIFCQFTQPLSVSSTTSTSSLASLGFPESPLSLKSQGSGSTTTSIQEEAHIHICPLGDSTKTREIDFLETTVVGTFTGSQNSPMSDLSSLKSTFLGNDEDNALSLEDIEKSASILEAKEDLLDLDDIQTLLELSADHSLADHSLADHSLSDHSLADHSLTASICAQPAADGTVSIATMGSNSGLNNQTEMRNEEWCADNSGTAQFRNDLLPHDLKMCASLSPSSVELTRGQSLHAYSAEHSCRLPSGVQIGQTNSMANQINSMPNQITSMSNRVNSPSNHSTITAPDEAKEGKHLQRKTLSNAGRISDSESNNPRGKTSNYTLRDVAREAQQCIPQYPVRENVPLPSNIQHLYSNLRQLLMAHSKRIITNGSNQLISNLSVSSDVSVGGRNEGVQSFAVRPHISGRAPGNKNRSSQPPARIRPSNLPYSQHGTSPSGTTASMSILQRALLMDVFTVADSPKARSPDSGGAGEPTHFLRR